MASNRHLGRIVALQTLYEYEFRIQSNDESADVKGILHSADEFFPYELMNPQDYTEMTIHLVMGCPATIKIKYIWDDESGKNNEFEQVLTL